MQELFLQMLNWSCFPKWLIIADILVVLFSKLEATTNI